MMGVSEPALAVRDVGFTYGGDFRVADVSFEVEQGSVLTMLGPNGSGKTTLFGVIAGAQLPVRGEVYFHGINLHRHLHQCSRQLVAVPFRPPLYTVRTPYLYWQAMGLRYGMSFRQTARRIAELAPQMDMTPHIHKLYAQLSLGMQQKAALVAAFLPDVKLRLIDEPFSGGIDPLAMEVLAQWIQDARGRGETTIFSAQLLEHAQRLADRVLVLKDGRAVAFGTMDEIVRRAGLTGEEDRAFAQAYVEVTEGTPHE